MGKIILAVVAIVAVSLYLRYRQFMRENPVPPALQLGTTFSASPALSQTSIATVSKNYRFFGDGQQVLVKTSGQQSFQLSVFTFVDVGAEQLAVPMFQGPVAQYAIFGNSNRNLELGWISPQQSIITNYVPSHMNAQQLTFTSLKFPVDASIKEYVFLVRSQSVANDPWRIFRVKPEEIVDHETITMPAIDSLPKIDKIGDEATLKYVNKRVDALNDDFLTLPPAHD